VWGVFNVLKMGGWGRCVRCDCCGFKSYVSFLQSVLTTPHPPIHPTKSNLASTTGAASRHPSVAGTLLQPILQYAPIALYSLTLASLYFKLQLPQAVLLHWLATSAFTLTLQLSLRNPKLRSALGYPGGPAAIQGGGVTSVTGVDPGLQVRVAAAGNADVLVAMAARESAMQRYGDALYCLQEAIKLDPGNAG